MSEADRSLLWSYHSKQGLQLSDWSWGWRLGWIRVCAKPSEFCRQRLYEALVDRALVVRAEAATQLGRVYTGTANPEVLKHLEVAFENKRNDRNGKPMFVLQRILEAIHLISGKETLTIGKRLASRYPETLKYWNQISRF